MITPAAKRLWFTSDRLNIEWADGSASEFSSLWLRDNLREDRDAHSGQRLIDIADLPAQPRIRNAAPDNGSVNVEWESEQRPARFELGWLREHASVGRRPFAPRLWLEAAGLTAKDFA